MAFFFCASVTTTGLPLRGALQGLAILLCEKLPRYLAVTTQLIPRNR